MIHTLLMGLLFLLKLVGIVLAVILSLILLILLLVLFCPVRYELQGVSKEQQMGIEGKVSWLFHGVAFLAGWDKKEGISYDIHLFGISLKKLSSYIKKIKQRRQNKKSIKQKIEQHPVEDKKTSGFVEVSEETEKPESTEVPEETEKPESAGAPEETEKPESAGVPEETEKLESAEVPEKTEKSESIKKTVDFKEAEKLEDSRNSKEKKKQKKDVTVQIKNIISSVTAKIRSVWDTIQKAASGVQEKKKELEDRIQSVKTKISDLSKFLSSARTKKAFEHVKRELIILLKHCRPRKASGFAHFGFEDPSVTGKILAIAGMTLPIHKNRIQIQPDFENQIIEFDAKTKGRIYGFVLAGIGLRLFFDKNIKYVIYKVRYKGN